VLDALLTKVQSPTQSWSASCLIDLYQDAKEFGEEFAKSE